MMICVQTGHKEEFDKLWRWTKNHMWHNNGGEAWEGYFAGICNTNGSRRDEICHPNAEMYFIASLLFAANYWNDDQYMDDAQKILKLMWENRQYKLFNPTTNVIVFLPTSGEMTFTCPANSLPAFLELFARWSETNRDKWTMTVSAARTQLYKSSNTKSGLFADYANFDGTPHSADYLLNPQKYYVEAMRCAMNFGADYYLFGVDAKRETEMAKRIIDFFEKDNYQHARFNWDGSNPSESYTQGEKGANAVAALALENESGYEDIIKKNLKMAWDEKFMTGQYRYYDGLVHYLAMLHLTGSFKIWKPKPTVESEEKTITDTEINGVTYQDGDKVDYFEGCKLYKATIKAAAQPGPGNDSTVVNDSLQGFSRINPYAGSYKMLRSYDLKGCKVNDAKKANHGAYYGKKVLMK